jgi:Uncharacterized protein conserved in bacteria (DUF2325)
MASLCILHNDPASGRGAFSAVPTPQFDASEFGSARRAKIWELSSTLHCSIVGTCLTASELRRFFIRFGDDGARTASDHELHGRGVVAASRRDDGGKLLNKALDKRHEAAIRRFAKAESTTQLRALWTQALDQGEIAGPYWALLTHPTADAKLVQDVFGDVHMLSHQVGAAARLDIARLRRLEAELSERDDKIARQQARLAASAAERVAMRETIERLEARLAEFEASPSVVAPSEGGSAALEKLQRKLADETARATSLELKLAASEEKRERAEAERRDAVAVANLARRELAALEAALEPPDEAGAREFGELLRGARILYVGGRPKLIDQLKAFVAVRGGALIAHDGGVDDSLALLPGLVSQADVVYFPVDCISHAAADKIKKLCQRLAKRWAPLRSASLASFASEIEAGADLGCGRFSAAAE